jgi:LacI family transcriptional regulator/LacI family repressor for deo operon, udp, cdd, tsx, nupC, and nupG
MGNESAGIGIKELARLCKVSIGTVDRSLHNRKGVAPATRKRVLACARKHGFRPDPVARRLVTGKTTMVGAVLPTAQLTVENELAALVAAKRALSEHGYMLLIVPEGSAEEFADAYRDLAYAGCRTVISLSGRSAIPEETHLHTVALLHRIDRPRSVSLVPDERETGARACRFLHGKNHHRVAYIDSPYHGWAQKERLIGFREEAARHAMDVRYSSDPADVVDMVGEGKAGAVFCHSDGIALQTLAILEGRGLSVPGDVSLMGVDDMPSLARRRPDLTTMRYDFANVGRLAARQAIALSEGISTPPPPLIPPLEIVERGTVIPRSS